MGIVKTHESAAARERRLARKRAYYQAHRDEILAANRVRSEGKKEQIAERMKAWRDRNIDRIRERERAYTKENKELIRQRRQEQAAAMAYRRAKDRAKAKGIEFSISLDYVKGVVDGGVCQLTGIPFQKRFGSVKERSFYFPSIDRIDASKGYAPGNVRVVLAGVNMMMNTWGPEKIIEVADAIRRAASAEMVSA